MDARKRIIAPCATILSNDTVKVDLSGFVLRLLLFEKFILYSHRLREFPALVKAFGYEPVRELLASGAIDIHCGTAKFGQVGQPDVPRRRELGGPLPLGSYAIVGIKVSSWREYIHRCLMQSIYSVDGMNARQVAELRNNIRPRLVAPLNRQAENEMTEQFSADLTSNRPHVKTAVALALKERLNTEVSPSDFSLQVHLVEKIGVRTETNISEVVHLSDIDIHRVVGRGLLAVGFLNQRLAEMGAYTAISGFKAAELPVFEKKIDILSTALVPEAEAQVGRMKRVLAIKGFDDLDELIAKGKVDLIKLLEIRDTRECREFRDWLWEIDSISDAELEERINSLRDKLSWFVHGSEGKTLRWLATAGLGLIPGGGTVAGAVGGALDTFLVDKILPNPGPLSFINNMYPSIFINQGPSSWAEGLVVYSEAQRRREM